MARVQLRNGNWVDDSTLPMRNGQRYDPTAQDQAALGSVNPAARQDIAHGAANQDDPNMQWDANSGRWIQKPGTVLNYEQAKRGFMQTAGAQAANSNRLTALRPQTVNPQTMTSAPSGVAPVTTVQRQAAPGPLGAVQPQVTRFDSSLAPTTTVQRESYTDPNGMTRSTSAPLNLALKTIVPRIIPAAGAIIGGLVNNNAANNATNTLTAGGNKAIDTVTAAGTAAQGHITDATAKTEAALNPYMAAGAKTLAELLKGLEPGGGLVDSFKYNPQDPAQNPAYAFRLKQGEKAIGNVQSSKGAAYSGATLKALSDYNTGQAQQFWDDDYAQQENTFRKNQSTRLGALQDIAGQGQLAAQAYAGFLTSAGGNLALIQQRTAEAVSSLQAQIASAQAAGEIDKANALTGTIESIIKQFTDAMTAQAAANAARPPVTNTNTNTVTVNNSQPSVVTNPDGTKTVTIPGQPPFTIPAAPTFPVPNGGTLDPTGSSTVRVTDTNGNVIKDATGAAAGTAGTYLANGARTAGTLGSVAVPASGALATGAVPALVPASTLAATGTASAAAGAASAPIAPGAAAASSPSSSLVGFLTNPITAVAAAAIIGTISWIKSQAHWEANTWVQGFQNPFDDQMDDINRQFGALASSGQLDRQTAMAMRNSVSEAMGLYEQKRQEFATKGKDNDTVARNALATFNEAYGENGSKMLNWLDSWLASLPDPAAQTNPPDAGALGSLNPGSLMRGVA